MNSSEDPSFYEAFKDAEFPRSFVIICAVRAVIALLGLFLNGALVFVTVRSKHLRNRCNALLAFDAVCSTLAMSSNLVLFAVVCFGPKFIELRLCFWLQFVPTLFINLLLNAMLSIGIERLIGVVAPFWVNEFDKFRSTIYVSVLILLCVVYAVYAMVRLYPVSLIEMPEMPVLCVMNDLYQGEVGMELFRNCMIFTGLTILCYAIIWATIRFKSNQAQIDYTKRIFKSLLVNVLFVSTGYFLNAGFLILLTKISLSQVHIVFGIHSLGIFTSISSTSNPITLYMFSSDYRQAFNEHLFRYKRRPIHSTVLGTRGINGVGAVPKQKQNALQQRTICKVKPVQQQQQVAWSN